MAYKVNWEQLKAFVDSRGVSVQYVDLGDSYLLVALDGVFAVESLMYKVEPRSPEQVDFEDNYKLSGNKSPVSEVVSQYEKNDKSLKLVSDCEPVNSQSGEAVLLIKVPGTPNVDKRYIAGGTAWFETPEPLDRVKVYVTDEDNLLGYGPGAVIGSYTDDDADESKRGWYIPGNPSSISVSAIGGYGVLPAGFYIKIVGVKQNPATGGRFFCNVQWGKPDGSL